MFIDGFAIGGYRSFGNEVQSIAPLGKINLIIGQNNSGKSNILRFLDHHFVGVARACLGNVRHQDLNFTELDKHRGGNKGNFHFSIAIKSSGENYKKLMSKLAPDFNRHNQMRDIITRLLNSNVFKNDDDLIWFRYSANSFVNGYGINPEFKSSILQDQPISEDEWSICANILKQQHGNLNQYINQVMNYLSPLTLDLPKIKMIQAFRKVSRKPNEVGHDTEYDYSGIGIIEELNKLQNPDHYEQENKQRFNDIIKFIKVVLENESASLSVPHTIDKINVQMDGKVLPLESLGTGVHEVIILAVAATILEDHVVCIEEPEIHLHPRLQKKLINYLKEKTTNQYLIATHSAHLLDAYPDSILHVKYEDGHSIVTPIIKSYDKFMICEDLGYKASDIIQSNCIVWVEGPSDRIYINHWLESESDDLVEGVHYSIMFYGGNLLSHLSAEHEDVNNFIKLRSINRKMCIIMDSDKKSSNDSVNKTKSRIKKEFNDGTAYAWITEGREIENYLDPNLMESVIKKLYGNNSKLASRDKYSKLCKYKKTKSSDTYDGDKVKIAHEITKYPADLQVFDLKKCIGKLSEFIKESNA